MGISKFISTVTIAALLLGDAVGAHAKKGGDVNARDKDDQTALMRAAAAGNTDEVKDLIAAGADVNSTVQAQSAAMVIAHKRTPPVATLGQTALMMAAAGGHAEVVSQLLAAHANVNAAARDSRTSLIFASQSNIDVVKLLLHAGANLEARFLFPMSITRTLKSRPTNLAPGETFHGVDSNGAIMTITTSPAGEVQETLSGGICQTAVTWAALGGNAEIVQLLLDAGASPAGCEVTALEAAKAEHHQKVVDLLVARGVKE